MNYETLILSREEGIATITLNRPDRMNALTPESVKELERAIEDVGQDDGIGVLVITGAGRGFCAGADVRDMVERQQGGPTEGRLAGLRAYYGFIPKLISLEKPVIASVNGAAVGMGCNLSLACDIRIASERAKFGEVFVRRGLNVEGGGSYFLPRLVGMGKACELVFTGDIIDAREAERIGLVNSVVPHEQLQTATRELASRIAKGPRVAIGLSKAALYKAGERDLLTALEFEVLAQGVSSQTEDSMEAMRAFLESREPEFKGR